MVSIHHSFKAFTPLINPVKHLICELAKAIVNIAIPDVPYKFQLCPL